MKKEGTTPLRLKHYKSLRRKYIIRLALTYIAPSIILILFFIFQHLSIQKENQNSHLLSVAESQSRILDIFVMERVANLLNLIDGIDLEKKINLVDYLENLKKTSPSFIDIGLFDNSSVQTLYEGPERNLTNKDYINQRWFDELIKLDKRYVVTDIYLGLRGKPHFTIAVKRQIKDKYIVMKSSLDPAKIYEYLTSMEHSMDVNLAIVNTKGEYQLVSQKHSLLKSCPIIPDLSKQKGIAFRTINDIDISYSYSWLSGTNWAVISSQNTVTGFFVIFTSNLNILIGSLSIIIILIIIVIVRSKSMVLSDYEKDIVHSQLEQASKLATVGELSAGIAHEIGNPLNIIANEVGIMQDYADPRFKMNKTIADLQPNFDKIMKAVFRCKDINKKLLTFVRKDGLEITSSDINFIIKDLINGFFERELSYQNIKVKFDLQDNIPNILIDANQIRQVLINLINNASDAIGDGGTITINTKTADNEILITVTDTGCGIEKDKIEKIFLPFFTTKPVGKGTGLGLSVSYGIVKSHNGNMHVESIPGLGTSFIIHLPIK
jgi:two-component system NtrC family sensor kinase